MDGTVCMVVVVAGSLGFMVLAMGWGPRGLVPPTAAGTMLWTVALFLLLFEDAVGNGRSLGKVLLGTQVISTKHGRPCSYSQSFGRDLFICLPLINILDSLWIFGPKRQRIGDVAANTVVVKYEETAHTRGTHPVMSIS